MRAVRPRERRLELRRQRYRHRSRRFPAAFEPNRVRSLGAVAAMALRVQHDGVAYIASQ